MKKLLISLVILSVMFGVLVFADSLGQPGTVTIGEDIEVVIDSADFGTVFPGDTPTDVTTVDNTGSNVAVTLNTVVLNTSGTVFDSLTIDGTGYASFSVVVPAFETDDLTLQITIPTDATPDTVTNTIIYQVTGPTP